MKTTSLLTLLLLSGCASTSNWIQDHPRATTIIATSVLLSAAIALDQGHKHGPVTLPPEPRMSTPLTPNCTVYPEMCK